MNTRLPGDPSRNGAIHVFRTPERKPHYQMGNKTIYGMALVFVALFKFSMTWLASVKPEPMNATITAFAGCVGIVLMVLGWREDRRSDRHN